jgi:prepilin-type N-terminal cleavage/methylation domain-containing protein
MKKRSTPGGGDDAGFTLIELLIVIVLLGVLSTVVVFAVGGITDRGTTAACRADGRALETAMFAYFAESGETSVAGNIPQRMNLLVTNGYIARASTKYQIADPGNVLSAVEDSPCTTGMLN